MREQGEEKKAGVSGVKRGLFFWLAVVLPAFTVLLEVLTGFCAGVFFDPVPTGWHVLLVSMVPVANGVLLLALNRQHGGLWRWAILLNGLALVVAGYYSALYAPLLPMAVPALILAGIGLLPMAVVLGFIGSVAGVRWAGAACRGGVVEIAGRTRWLFLGVGFVVGGVGLAALEGPAFVTREGLLMATADNEKTRDRGIALLRNFGSERSLLQACYEGDWMRASAKDTVGWVYGMGRRVETSDAQTVFYRVTGKPFNSLKPPRAMLRSRRGQAFDDFEWDSAQGGDAVAGQVADLDLVSSRIDSHVDADSALAYTEWTMVFRNTGTVQKEARFQAMLPPLGVVSGLSLWIDGEEREAAFSSRSRVKAAYKKVVERRRDPVLVTTTGPDRVLVQCFPVPPSGGEMKIRFGVTCPLDRGVVKGRLWLPQVVERNFGIDEALEHSLWVQSESGLESPLGTTTDDAEETGVVALRAVLAHAAFQGSDCYVDCEAVGEGAPLVWTRDPFAGEGEGGMLVRKRGESIAVPVKRLVVVVDGSVAMEPHREAISEALAALPGGMKMTVLLAGDRAEVLGDGAEGAGALRRVEMRGGIDNTEGLAEALALAGAGQDAAVVWLHGPQPVLLGGADRLAQYFERTMRPIPLYAIPVVVGANRLLEELQRQTAVRPGVRLAEVEADLGVFLGQLAEGLTEPGYEWQRSDVEPAEGKGVWDQLARYLAFGEVMDRYLAGEKGGAGTDMAASYQLVTPFSGAVVLETVEQFKAAGLEAVGAATAAAVPVIQEPSSAVLLILSFMALVLRRSRG